MGGAVLLGESNAEVHPLVEAGEWADWIRAAGCTRWPLATGWVVGRLGQLPPLVRGDGALEMAAGQRRPRALSGLPPLNPSGSSLSGISPRVFAHVSSVQYSMQYRSVSVD